MAVLSRGQPSCIFGLPVTTLGCLNTVNVYFGYKFMIVHRSTALFFWLSDGCFVVVVDTGEKPLVKPRSTILQMILDHDKGVIWCLSKHQTDACIEVIFE